MRRFVIAGLVLAAATAAGTAMAGGLLSGGKQAKPARGAATLAACHCKQGPPGPRGRTGPQGPQGETGPQGPQGPAGTGLFAVVNIDGSVYKQNGVTGVTHDGVGAYTVTFSRQVDGCAAVATVGGHQTTSVPLGFAALSTQDTKVTVATWRFTDVGTLPGIERADKGFHLEVSC